MPRCLVVQHLEPEGAYAIADTLERHGIGIDVCRVYAGDAVPTDVGGFDAVVVMGGTMSAASDDAFPSRRAELALLIDALAHDVPTLGVCLGAQLLAAAAGAKVFPGDAGAEIGWKPVTWCPGAAEDVLLAGTGPTLTVLHWHGDTFDLPPGAVLLATSDQYAHQAFRVGDAAWGLQFHLEVDEGAVAAFVRAFGADAARSGADPRSIVDIAPGVLEVLRPQRDIVLGHFAALVRERAVNSGDSRCL